MQSAPGSNTRAAIDCVCGERAACTGADRARQCGHRIDRREGREREGGHPELRQREAAGGTFAARGQAGSDGASQRDPGQEAREHRRERIHASAEHVAEQSRPEHLVAEGSDSGERHQRQDPARAAGGGAGRRRGLGGRLELSGAACEQRRESEDERIDGGAEVHRRTQSERGQQHECRAGRAEDRACRVRRVEQPDAPTDLVVAAHGVAGQQRKRRAHQPGRDQQDRERAQQVEERAGELPPFGRRRTAAEEQRVERGRRADCAGDGERARRDAELEQPVDEHGPAYAGGEAGGDAGARCEAAHVGGEHAHQRELRGSEDEGELPRPRGFVEQSGEAREQETQQQQRKAE